jgi:hypothetical protein
MNVALPVKNPVESLGKLKKNLLISNLALAENTPCCGQSYKIFFSNPRLQVVSSKLVCISITQTNTLV